MHLRYLQKKYGMEYLLDCLEKKEERGVVYLREGITGDYDEFDDIQKFMDFIKTGQR